MFAYDIFFNISYIYSFSTFVMALGRERESIEGERWDVLRPSASKTFLFPFSPYFAFSICRSRQWQIIATEIKQRNERRLGNRDIEAKLQRRPCSAREKKGKTKYTQLETSNVRR